ncbi:hypothetical protein [Isoptericola sp. NPDC057559]|uniref:hypothetical protein n=1 Tax=Isoptericola sp. NPDC057559 TaxID=3346168 RepID=UPI0036807D1A
MKRRRVLVVGLVSGVLSLSACANDPYAAFRDRGDAVQVASVRADVLGLLEAENEAGRLVLAADGSLGSENNASASATERRRAELGRVAVQGRAEDELGIIDASIAELVAAPHDAELLGYTHAQLDLEDFRGVAVDADAATVLFRGTECYISLDGARSCGPPSDFRLTLVRRQGRWLISEKTSQHLPGEGP